MRILDLENMISDRQKEIDQLLIYKKNMNDKNQKSIE